MKLERLPEYVITTVATIFGVVLALYCGKLVGEGRSGMVFAIFAAIFGVVFVIGLRTRVWLLIPFLAPFPGQIPQLFLPFSVRHLAVMFVAAAFAALSAQKVLRRRVSYGFIDLLLSANVLYLATVLIRNPVGTLATGSERIGGKPYFEVAIAFLAYLLLARATMTLRETRRLPFLMILGTAVQGFIEAVTYFSPALSMRISTFYTGVTVHEAALRPSNNQEVVRHGYLGGVASQASLAMCAWYRPLTLLSPLYFWRALGLFILVVGIFFTGFRSILLGLGCYFALSAYIRAGITEVIRTCWFGVAAVLIMVTLQGNVVNFPPSVQRALSFLPGKWDPSVVSDSSQSTEWRIEMWKEMLFTDRYIQSKMLGDGFGFSLREFQIQQALEVAPTDLQDYFLITGSVHSGPISAIRYVGVVGLILYTWLMLHIARSAFAIIRRAQGTPYFEPAMFICMPMIFAPFQYYVIFGAFDTALPQSIIFVGFLRVMLNALDDGLPVASTMVAKEGRAAGASLRPSLAFVAK